MRVFLFLELPLGLCCQPGPAAAEEKPAVRSLELHPGDCVTAVWVRPQQRRDREGVISDPRLADAVQAVPVAILCVPGCWAGRTVAVVQSALGPAGWDGVQQERYAVDEPSRRAALAPVGDDDEASSSPEGREVIQPYMVKHRRSIVSCSRARRCGQTRSVSGYRRGGLLAWYQSQERSNSRSRSWRSNRSRSFVR